MRDTGQTLYQIATHYHRQLRDVVEALQERAARDPQVDPELRAFLDCLGKHAKRMHGLLEAHQTHSGVATLTRVWRYSPASPAPEAVLALAAAPSASAAQAMAGVLSSQNELVRWYEQLAAQAAPPAIQEELHRLAAVERSAARQLAASAQGLASPSRIPSAGFLGNPLDAHSVRCDAA